MNLGALLKVYDTVMAFRDATKRPKGSAPAATSMAEASASQASSPIEARLAGVVVAALKEAFDRDHARLELERAQLDEQRRRSEEMLRIELQRQALDREQGRLRLLAGTALVGWITSVVALGSHIGSAAGASRFALASGWLLLLAAIASAFAAQARLSAHIPDGKNAHDVRTMGAVSLWSLMAGLALTALSLLL